MNSARTLLRALLVSVATFLLSSAPASARQDPTPPPPKDEQPKPAATSTPLVFNGDATGDQDVESVPTGPPNPYAGTIKDVGTGLPLLGTSSTPLRWGSFSVYTFESIGLHDNFLPLGASTTTSTDLAIFRFGLMFDHYVLRHKSRIILQYLPQLLVGDGQVRANGASNNNVTLGTKFELTPRLSLTVEDNFLQIHGNSLLPQNYLAVNAQVGALAQNYFLNASGNFLADRADATLEYDLTPRTNITFSPSFRYMQSTNPVATDSANGRAYAGAVSVGHALAPHRTIGLSGSYQYLSETIGSVPQNAAYYTVGAYYSEQLARTLWVTANVGATDQHYAALAQPGGWGLSAGAALTKAFSRRVTLGLAYSRGTAFTNYVTRERADRADGTFGVTVSSRVVWNAGVGYYRELGGPSPSSGKYGTTGIVYRFYGNFSLFTTFAYTNQSPGTQQLLSGNEKTIVYGARWSPPWVASK
jgi:hypothetical protein